VTELDSVSVPREIELLRSSVQAGLERARERLAGARYPLPAPDGKLLRPVLACAVVPSSARADLPDSFWAGALAVQMIHEASLLHDDVVDGGEERRGLPSRVRAAGLAAALVEGDHLLTGAFRVVAEHSPPGFMSVFCRAVEGTVAGEREQGEACGSIVPEDRYRRIIRGKSGELFGAALALSAETLGGNPAEAFEAGCRIGSLYQMVDDLLDLCPDACLGKPPFQDYLQARWTFPLGLAGLDSFHLSSDEVLKRLFDAPPGGLSPMERGVARLRTEEAGVAALLALVFPEADEARLVIRSWIDRAHEVVQREQANRRIREAPRARSSAPGSSPRDLVVREASRLSSAPEWLAYFAQHGTSFRFASRLFPPGPRDVVSGVYAFCRFTDDLVDHREDLPPAEREVLLDAWLEISREAYETGKSGVALLDAVMGDAARASVPFRYPSELVEGVRMDLAPVTYGDIPHLRVYSYRVASVVGLWLTERFGVRDPWVLERAAALGHAMQLTNILRDVGEDLRRGRLYLPMDRVAAHGLDRALLEQAALEQLPLPVGYAALVEELLQHAEEDYRDSFPAIAALPPFFQRPVAVASHVYRGIHDSIRRNGYNNLGRRAFTTLPRKGILAAGALLALRRVRRDVRTGSGATAPAGPWLAREGRGETA
jgi:15-cis-phytoene synthase